MKTKKIILLALVAILATSCKGEEIGRCELTEPQKQLIPYAKGQVVSFVDSTGWAIDVTVTESTQDWLQARDDEEQGYFTYERKMVILKSESSNLELSLKLYSFGCLSRIDYNEFSIGIKHLNEGCGVFTLYFDAEGKIDIGTYTYSSTSFHKSLEISGKAYYDVTEQKHEYEVKYGRPRVPIQLFYNKTYGILQINKEGNNFLTINPKTEEGKENNNPDMIDCFDIPLAERNVQ